MDICRIHDQYFEKRAPLRKQEFVREASQIIDPNLISFPTNWSHLSPPTPVSDHPTTDATIATIHFISRGCSLWKDQNRKRKGVVNEELTQRERYESRGARQKQRCFRRYTPESDKPSMACSVPFSFVFGCRGETIRSGGCEAYDPEVVDLGSSAGREREGGKGNPLSKNNKVRPHSR